MTGSQIMIFGGIIPASESDRNIVETDDGQEEVTASTDPQTQVLLDNGTRVSLTA